ncbi:MAG: biopolymer transporter ExbD [Gammaproteobacteria bacterium]|nr:MAG: biopolymer transporter ExbD [Gammaproteobacteria bacterium]
MRRRRSKARRQEQQELDITAFLNLMVILVPFLLITAVFSRLAIIELSVPTSADGGEAVEESLQLEVIVRGDAIEIGGRDAGLLTVLPRDEEAGYDFAGLNTYLQRIKAEDPDRTVATVLLEPDVNYDVLVQVMDAVRLYEAEAGGAMVQAELFPDIAVGDAPARTQGG